VLLLLQLLHSKHLLLVQPLPLHLQQLLCQAHLGSDQPLLWTEISLNVLVARPATSVLLRLDLDLLIFFAERTLVDLLIRWRGFRFLDTLAFGLLFRKVRGLFRGLNVYRVRVLLLNVLLDSHVEAFLPELLLILHLNGRVTIAPLFNLKVVPDLVRLVSICHSYVLERRGLW
jgi:hypothetical protein